MTRRLDVEKRREWEKRFERFRASGSTVARFCASESVSEHTFYYWAKRIGRRSAPAQSAPARSAARNVASERQSEPARHRRGAGGSRPAAANSPLVHFRLHGGMEVSVPADCLDVIRCLVNSAPSARVPGSDAFHEVIVGKR